MENVEHIPPVMPPLAWNCLPAAVEPSSRTTTGRRCQLFYCIEMIEGAHFSQNPLCCYRIVAPALNSASSNCIPHSPASTNHSIPSLAPPSTRHTEIHQENMLHVRHIMRSRRGSSKGRAIRPPSVSLSNSTQADSSSPLIVAHGMSWYSNMRSGKGQAQRVGLRCNVETQLPHDYSVPIMNPCHSTQFQFRFTLDRSYIIATISVAFREEPQCTVVPTSIILDRTRASNRNTHDSSSQGDALNMMDVARSDLEAMNRMNNNPGGNWKMAAATSTPSGESQMETMTSGQQHDVEDLYAYGCLVVEEPLPLIDT